MGRHMGPPEASVGRQHARTRDPPGLGEVACCVGGSVLAAEAYDVGLMGGGATSTR